MKKVEDVEIGIVNVVYLIVKESSFLTNNDYSLYKLTILGSVTTIDIFTDLAPKPYHWEPLRTDSRIRYCGFRYCHRKEFERILRIRNAAYCPDFMTNLVSLTKLMKRGIHWDTENRRLYRSIDRSIVCQLRLIAACLESQPVERCYEAYAVNRLPVRPKATNN